MSLDTGSSYESVTVQKLGTAAGAATTTVAPTGVGDTNLKVSSITGFVVGHKAVIDEAGRVTRARPVEDGDDHVDRHRGAAR